MHFVGSHFMLVLRDFSHGNWGRSLDFEAVDHLASRGLLVRDRKVESLWKNAESLTVFNENQKIRFDRARGNGNPNNAPAYKITKRGQRMLRLARYQ